MIDLTPIFEAILALLAALVTYKLIPWIKARTTAEQQSLLAATVRTLVYAAEQLYGAGKGAEKLDYVISELEKRGFTADRAAIDEELVRLGSHVSQLRALLDDPAPAGRRLDFLAQEFNREVNTIASKSQDIEITRLAMDAKAEIEKLREQVQNVE